MQQKEEKVEKDKGQKFNYFVDGEKFESDVPQITGALIRVKLPEAKRNYALYLEGHGTDPDMLVADVTIISLEKGAKHFTTAPPASFGVV